MTSNDSMITVEEAQRLILTSLPALGCEELPVIGSFGRVAKKELKANIDVPCFDNSSMDGYAVKSEDTLGSEGKRKISLRVVGEIPAGGNWSGRLQNGECLRIFTGSMLPNGADAVLMQEDTRMHSSVEGRTIELLDSVKPWENIRFKGEDIRKGTVVLETGELIDSGQMAVLASQGFEFLSVSKRPRVGLLSTGSELVGPGKALASGQIYESNSTTIAALLAKVGIEASVLKVASDSEEEVSRSLGGSPEEL